MNDLDPQLGTVTFAINSGQGNTFQIGQDGQYVLQYAHQSTPPGSYPTNGAFVIGDGSASGGSTVTFWGSQWAKSNALSGGSAPNAFKGFEDGSQPTSCGGTWTASPPPKPPTPPASLLARPPPGNITGDPAPLVGQRTYPPPPGRGTGAIRPGARSTPAVGSPTPAQSR